MWNTPTWGSQQRQQQWSGWTGSGTAIPSGWLPPTECTRPSYFHSCYTDAKRGEENPGLRRLIRILYSDHKTQWLCLHSSCGYRSLSRSNEATQAGLVRPYEPARHFVHNCRRRRGRQKITWLAKVKEWMGRSVQDLTISQGLTGDSCQRCFSPAVVPTTNSGVPALSFIIQSRE